jgi:hypothetical protein
MAEPAGNQSGKATPMGSAEAQISDVKKGVVTLDYVPPKKSQTPVRH